MNDHHAATIDRFDPTRGFGTARLADGRVLNFDASVAFAKLAELAPGAAVLVALGQSRRTGEATIVRLWFAGREPAAPQIEDPLTATPEQTLAALRAAGLASGIDVARFHDACLAEWRAEQAMWQDDDEDDEDDENDDEDDEDEEPEAFEANTLLVALASLHGTHGPTASSAAEGIFFVDEDAASDPEVRARAQAVLEQWLGRPLPPQVTDELEDMVYYVGDTLHLRQHTAGPGAAMLYASEGVREADDLAFTVYARLQDVDALRAVPIGFSPRISPDTEAAAAGIFRYDGCDLAFAEHAPACAVCQANLAAVARTNQLPQGFAALIVP
jgi:hypothetical protein